MVITIIYGLYYQMNKKEGNRKPTRHQHFRLSSLQSVQMHGPATLSSVTDSLPLLLYPLDLSTQVTPLMHSVSCLSIVIRKEPNTAFYLKLLL